MSTLVEIQQQFNDALLSGVSYAITNHPILGWNSGFGLVKGIAAVCFLIATIDVASKIADSKAFITSFLKTIFLLIIVLANFGQIDHRKFLPIESTLKAYKTDYMEAPEPAVLQSIFGNNKNAMPMKPMPQLDRDIYNVLKGFFDEMGDKLVGKAPGDDTALNQNDVQGSSIRSTVYFLTQVRVAKMKCILKQDDKEYGACLSQYIPTSDPDPKNTGKISYADANACNGQKCKGESDSVDTSQAGGKTEEGFFESVWNKSKAMGEGLLTMVSILANMQMMLYYIVADIVFLVAFPVILWVLDVARSLFAAYVMLTIGFKTAGMLFFAKILSPLILLDSKRNDVFSAYKSVFSMALFNFMSKLFISFATILAIGLKQGVYEVIAKSINVAKSGGAQAGVDMTANLGTLMFLVYISIFVILFIQIIAISKIESACNALMNWSVSEFVSIGRELGGSAVKVAMVASAGIMAAPFAVAAAAAAAPAIAASAGGLAASVGGSGMGALGGAKAALAGGGSMVSKLSGAGNALVSGGREIGRTVANSGVSAAGKVADFTKGEASGDRVRSMFGGSSGGGSSTPDSLSAEPKQDQKALNNKKRGEGESDGSDDGSSDDSSGSTVAKSGNSPKGGGGSGSSGSKSNSIAGESREEKKEREAKEKKDSETPGFMKNKFLQPAIMGLKAFDGVLNVAEKGSKGQITSIGDASGAFGSGYSRGNGLGNAVDHNKFEYAMSERMNESSKAFAEKAAGSLDNYSDDKKMLSHNSLKDSMQSANLGDMSSDQKNQFELLMNDVKSDPNNKENINKLYGMANNFSLEKQQKSGLEGLLREESQVKSEFAKKEKQEQKLIQKYLSDPTVRNANNLTQAVSDGTISRQVITNSSGDISAMAENKSDSAFNSMTKSIEGIDSEKYNKDQKYRNSKEIQAKEKQMESLLSNDYSRNQLIGQDKVIDQLEKLGKMKPDDAASMKSFSSSKDAENTINDLKKELETLRATSYMSINEDLKIATDDKSQVFIMNQNQVSSDGIVLSKIQNSELKEKLVKYKAAVDIIVNNSSSYINKKIVSEDQVQIMKKISDLIKE